MTFLPSAIYLQAALPPPISPVLVIPSRHMKKKWISRERSSSLPLVSAVRKVASSGTGDVLFSVLAFR